MFGDQVMTPISRSPQAVIKKKGSEIEKKEKIIDDEIDDTGFNFDKKGNRSIFISPSFSSFPN